MKALARPFGSAEITALLADIDELSDIKELIFAAVDENAPAMLKDGGVIRPGYNTEVDELRDIVHGGKGYLATLEAKLKEETGIRTLKIGYNRVFGYYIEVSRSFTNQVPANFVRKQTLANAERYITEELKELENKILGANERLAGRWNASCLTICCIKFRPSCRVSSEPRPAWPSLDVLTALAEVAVNNGYVQAGGG